MKRLQLFWKLIKNEKDIILPLLGLITIGLVCWFASTETEDFGLTFFTEMLGVAITVFIIDRVIQKREEKRSIPQKLAAYEDVKLYVNRYIIFWTEAYEQSVLEDDPKTIEEFFSKNGMPKIFDYLNMDSEPSVTPPIKWWDWMVQNAKKFKDNGDKILNRHSHGLDPIAFGFVHQLTESAFNIILLKLPLIRQLDASEKFKIIKIPEHLFKKDFDAILGLIDWCNESFDMLKKHNDSIMKVTEYKPNKNREMPPKCMIPPEALKHQIDVLKYREQTN